jgi:hypothetical protein
MEQEQHKKPEEPKVITFRVFDMPVDLFKDYVAFAKLYHENKMWKVLEKGMELIKEEEKQIRALDAAQVGTRLTFLEDRMVAVEKELFKEEPSDRIPKTIGSRRK